jgi:iron-sulfur cluster assembly accessory protein
VADRGAGGTVRYMSETTVGTAGTTESAFPLALEANALDHAAGLWARENDANLALRVMVKPGGCAGFSYDLFFDDETMEGDVRVVHATEHGDFHVVVDGESAVLLAGARLTYSDDLGGSGFLVSNPGATRTCGCGSSFC